MTRTITLTLTLLVLTLAALPAGASGAVSVGLGDHGYSAFGDPHFGSSSSRGTWRCAPGTAAT